MVSISRIKSAITGKIKDMEIDLSEIPKGLNGNNSSGKRGI